MTDRRRQLFARLALLAFVVLGGLRMATLDYGEKISTNVLDLIPADEREPELHLLRTLANEQQARVVLIALSAPDAPPTKAADAFMASLKADRSFAEVSLANDETNRDKLGRFFFEHSNTYLLPGWLTRHRKTFEATGQPEARWTDWLAETTADELDAFLLRPESNAFQELIPSDPLLLLPGLATSAKSLGGEAQTDGNNVLIWSRLANSPLEDAGQQPAFDAIEHALDAAKAINPSVTILWSGVNRFAAASKDRIRSEISLLNTLSIGAVLLVSCLLIRKPWRVLHLVPIILCSLLGAWVTVTLVFERLHILVFVIGALLTGAAIDYGFHLFLHASESEDEAYGPKLRRVLKPLLLSCFTTIAGFSLLLLSELPLIRHLGVFVASGLITAAGAALLYHAQFSGSPLTARELPSLPSGPRARSGWKVLLALGLVIALGGPWLLKWHDDIRELEVPTPELDANDAKVNALFGDQENKSIYLTGGDTLAEARTQLATFSNWHQQQFPDSTLASAALMLPSPADYAALPDQLAGLSGFTAALKPRLREHGYLPEAFNAFYISWEKFRQQTSFLPPYEKLSADLRPFLTGPMSMLLSEAEGRVWFASIADHHPGAEPPPELQTVGTNQLRTLNRLFSRYRASALNLSLIGMGVTGLSVILLYGWRRGLRIYAIPVGACFFTFGVLGLAGSTLNLFHLLGAFLGVCLSHDYAIFAAETRESGQPPPASIRLSALTTIASFGVLSFSRIAVISALGTTVTLTIVAALIAVELDAALRSGRKA